MLRDVVSSVCEPNVTFEEFAETARSFMESIAGLETLTESEASNLVNHLWRDHMAKKPAKGKKAAGKLVKPDKKHEEAPQAAESAAPKKTDTPAEAPKVDLNKPAVKKAIEEGQTVLKDGKSKADAAWAIYGRLKDEGKDLIVAAFIKGATLTERGALTYWYNCRKREAKEAKSSAK
jgi:hypothetical protein